MNVFKKVSMLFTLLVLVGVIKTSQFPVDADEVAADAVYDYCTSLCRQRHKKASYVSFKCDAKKIKDVGGRQKSLTTGCQCICQLDDDDED